MRPIYDFQILQRKFLQPVETFLENASVKTGRFWLILVVLVAVTLSFSLRWPAYGEMAAFPGTPYGQAISWWLAHPFHTVPTDQFFPASTIQESFNSGSASHCDKLAFRGLLPALNQVFPGGIWTLVVASNAAALGLFALVYLLVFRATGDVPTACYATWAFALSNTGRLGFSDFIFGDAISLLLLTAAMLVRSSWLAGLFVLISGFGDERALICAPLVALYHFWREADPFVSRKLSSDVTTAGRSAGPIALAVGLYGIIRLAIGHFGHVHIGHSELASTSILRFNFYQTPPVRLFDSFGGLWLLPWLLGLFLVAVRGWKAPGIWIYLVLMGLAAGPAFLVWDFERSLAYLLPGLLLTIGLLPLATRQKRNVLVVVLAVALLWYVPGSRATVLPEFLCIRLHQIL